MRHLITGGRRRRALAALIPISIGLLVAAGIGSADRNRAARSFAKPQPNPPAEIKHDVSPPLRSLPSKPRSRVRKQHVELRPPAPAGSGLPDPVRQTFAPSAAAPALKANFAGVSAVDSAPPDTNGAVGPTAYVQIVNESFQVFTKSGTSLYGPVQTNTVFSGFGGGCETNNDGDATVVYDRLANRWVIQQFSVSTSPYRECIAVSTSGDPAGSYYRYAFAFSDFPDYPKLGVWPDAYYMTFNLFSGGLTFAGSEVCAYNRARMLAGLSATQKCAVLDPAYPSPLPSDLDSSTPPPAGSPNYVMNFDTNSLNLWKAQVDWTTAALLTLTGPTVIPVAAFDPACGDGGACIPQKNTSQQLDSLGDRLMYRLAYRNFGDHESLVVTHAVNSGNVVGERWYELRDPNGTPTVYQQGTYAPAGKYRWMGSAAMDGSGDIALGFSVSNVSSGSSFPGIGYTGRLAGDPLGTMTQGEGVLQNGAGSQTSGLERWGDYSSMSIDPVDDCTFWYTSEYLATSGTFNWRTRIGAFSLPGCVAATTDDFSIAAGPAVTATQGSSASSSVTTAVTSGSAQTVTLSATGLPAGVTATFNPASVGAGGSSTLTLDLAPNTPTGTFPLTITGTGSTALHTTSLNLTVTPYTAVTNGDFEADLAGWTSGGFTSVVNAKKSGGHSASKAAQIGSTTPAAGDSNLSQTVTVPAGATGLSFLYQPHCRGKVPANAIQAEIRSTGGGTLASVLLVCANSNKWRTVVFDTSPYAGQDVVLWFDARGSGLKGKPSSFLLDDVALVLATGGNTIGNGGFETGDLTSWAASGALAPTTSPIAHSGGTSAHLGSESAFLGNSTLAQTVVVPGGKPTLTFWYQPHCADKITYDQIQVLLKNGSGQTLATPLNVCSNAGNWVHVTFDMKNYAGQAVVLTLNVHDDGYQGDPTYALFDDLSLS